MYTSEKTRGRGSVSRPSRIRSLIAPAATLALLASLTVVTPAAAAQQDMVLGDFESTTEGWTTVTEAGATIAVGSSSDAVTGSSSAQLDLDFTAGGWAAITRLVPNLDVSALTFSVKSDDVAQIAVRFVDGTGQTHQQRVDVAAGGWQEVTITDFAGGNTPEHWGGAADNAWHQPLGQLMLITNFWQTRDSATTAQILFDDVRVTYEAPDVVGPEISLGSTQVGNVFTTAETPEVTIDTDAETVTWTVRDARGVVVDSDAVAASSLGGRIAPDLTTPGWYELTVGGAASDGTAGPVVSTTLAIVEPFDLASVSDSPFGVATHFGQSWNPVLAPLIASAGIKTARDEAYWGEVETTPGVYTMPTKVVTYFDALENLDIDQMAILSYGNTLYDGGNAPMTPTARAAFAAYAVEMVRTLGTDRAVFEVWNEWNIGLGTNTPDQSADAYLELLKVVYPAIKAEFPDAVVVGPGMAGAVDPWLDRFLEIGGLDYVDALSVHPYNYPALPEALGDTLTRIEAGMRANNDGQLKPIVISEQGWPTGTATRSVSDELQAAYLVRAQTIALSHNVADFVIYDFMDDGPDPANTEHRFGLIHGPGDVQGAYTPKRSFSAQSTLTRQLTGYTFTENASANGINDYSFEKGADMTRVLWSDTAQTVTLAASGPVTVTDLYGATRVLDPGASGQISVMIGTEPIYLAGDTAALTAGSRFALAAVSATVGQPVQLSWTITNTGSTPFSGDLEIEGVIVHGEAAAGATVVVPVTLPAPTTRGPRTYLGTVTENGAAIAQLRADVMVTDSMTVTAAHALADDGSQVLRIVVSNASSGPLPLGAVDWTLGAQVGSGLAGSTIPAGGTLTLDVPLADIPTDSLTAFTVTVTAAEPGVPPAEASGQLRRVEDTAWTDAEHQAIVVDGAADNLSGLPIIDLATEGTSSVTGSTGAEDLSGTMQFTWDETNLYFTAVIADDIHAQPSSGGLIWQGDGIQLAIAAGAPGEAKAWTEVGLALTPTGPEAYRWMAVGEPSGAFPSATVKIVRDDATGVTTYEASFPWAHLMPIDPANGMFTLSALVNENDGAGREGTLEWGSGISGAKDSALMNAVRLVDNRVDTPTTTEGSTEPEKPAFSLSSTGMALPVFAAGLALLLLFAGIALALVKRRARGGIALEKRS